MANESLHKEDRAWAMREIFSIARCFYENKKYEEAIEKITFLKNHFLSLSITDNELVSIYEFEGRVFEKMKKYHDAINSGKKVLAICDKSSDPGLLKTKVYAFDRIGKNYWRLEDLISEIEYYHYALAEIQKNKFSLPEIEFHLLKNIGLSYKSIGNYEKSVEYLKKAETIASVQKTTNLKRTMLSELYSGMGMMYYSFDKYSYAIEYLEKSISIKAELFGRNTKSVALEKDNLGNVYYYLKEYKKAIYLFQSALNIYQKTESTNYTNVANLFSKIAACNTNIGEFDEAKYFLHKALSTLQFDSQRTYPFVGIKGKRRDLLIILYFTAKNHQKAYEAGRGRAELNEAARYFALCVRYLEFISNELDDPGSGTYFLDRFYYVIETAIGNCYDLYQETDSLHYVDQAFGYAERSKALLLKEALRKADVEEHLGLPAALLRRERSLAGELAGLENRRYEARQAGDEARSHELTGRIYSVRQAHKLLVDSIKTAYPAYAQIRDPVEPLAIEDVRARLLQPGQALVQYFEGEDELFIFTFTSGGCDFTRIPRDPSLKKAVEAFRESIYRWALEQEDSLLAPYLQYGQFLYRQLIGPIAAQLPPQLIIVPDGILEYLPFEALLYEAPPAGSAAFADYPYLLRRYRVSYAHSARLLHEMRRGEASAPRRQVLAFAPWFERVPGKEESVALRRNGLGRLYGNEEEAAHIRRLLKASVRKREEATRARFLEEAPLYSIIHLATHAKANDEEGEYSFLAFTGADDSLREARLYAKDLFNLRLPAEMVVLSACETGLGELRRGEGVISLARGFSQAGARSLITTLWRVSDKESAELMRLFYENLARGLPKDDALHRAKLSFIDAAPPSRAHPFFWAAFVPTGDMSPIRARRQGQGRWQWGLALLGAGLVGWWLRKRGR